MSALGILGKLITQGTKQINPGALPKNLQRAQSQGYDVDNKLYHATNADKIDEFRTDLIGSNTDEGFYGKGFYKRQVYLEKRLVVLYQNNQKDFYWCLVMHLSCFQERLLHSQYLLQ